MNPFSIAYFLIFAVALSSCGVAQTDRAEGASQALSETGLIKGISFPEIAQDMGPEEKRTAVETTTAQIDTSLKTCTQVETMMELYGQYHTPVLVWYSG